MLSTTKPVRSKTKISRGFDKHRNNQPFVFIQEMFSTKYFIGLFGIWAKTFFDPKCIRPIHFLRTVCLACHRWSWKMRPSSPLQMAHIADGPTENCIPSCSLPVCVSLWGQWLSYKWINNPKAKVNSLRTILKKKFFFSLYEGKFLFPQC